MEDECSLIGRQIGNYRVVAELASGGFGSVYQARHVVLTRRPPVAIKLLHAHLSTERERRRFLREAELLEQLTHPHILPVIDAGIHEGFPYLVAEYAAHGSLRDLLRSSSSLLPIDECLTILQQVGDALQFAHDRQIIHRDLKPDNILFNEQDEALLADFGIAITLSSQGIKHTSHLLGSPAYMAPEQFRGLISKETDQYALGCIAYELFTGRKPFPERDIYVLMQKHTQATPPALSELRPDIPVHIERAVKRAMAKSRPDRYPSVADFIAALHRPVRSGCSSRLSGRPVRRSQPDLDNSREIELSDEVLDVVDMDVPTRSRYGEDRSSFSVPVEPEEQEVPEPPILRRSSRRYPVAQSDAELSPPPGRQLRSQTPGRPVSASRIPPRSTRQLSPADIRHRHEDVQREPDHWGWVRIFLIAIALLLVVGLAVKIVPLLIFHDTPLQMIPGGQDIPIQIRGVQQSQTRQLSVRLSRSQTVPATGTKHVPGVSAKGTLTFLNGSFASYTVPAGIVITDAQGIEVVSDVDAVIPARTASGAGEFDVPAHAVNTGPGGDIPALDLNKVCCVTGGFIFVKNTSAFTGGQDPQSYTFVQQSDIDQATAALEKAVQQQALPALQAKKARNEQLQGQPECNFASPMSDYHAGDKVSNVNVTVTATCTIEARVGTG